MKLHLPLQLLAAVLANLSWTASADSISINFGTTDSQVSGKTGTAGLGPAVEAVGWNNAVGGSNTKTDLVDQEGVAIGGSVKWTAPQAPWGPGNKNPDGLLATIQSSYLDLGANNQWTVNISTGFLIADVYVYLSGDNGKYGAVNVNGTAYIGEALVDGQGGSRVATEADLASGWGDRSTSASGTLEFGTNALKVGEVNGVSINLSNVVSGNSGIRATLSGVQVVDATESYTWNRDITGDTTWNESVWTNGTGETAANKTWTDILADLSLRPIAGLSGTGTVTLGEAVSAEALIVKSGSNITLAGQQLNLTGLATLLAQSDATLTLGNAVSAEGVVTISGLGKVVSTVDQTWHGLAGSGTLEITTGTTLTLNGTVASDFTGHLILNEGSSATLSAANFSNSIRAEGSGTFSLNINGEGVSFGNSSVWRGNAATAATATHVATVTNATVNGHLTLVDGAGTFGKVETTITNTTVTGTLSLGSGSLSSSGGFVIAVGEGSNINNVRLGGQGSLIVGDVTLNVSGGTLGAGSAGSEGGMFTFVGQDASITGNIYFNITGGSIVAQNLAFGGFGQKNGHSLVGNVTMTLTEGTVESNIYAGSSWGGRIEGNLNVSLQGGTVGLTGQNRVLSAGCTGYNSWAAQAVSGKVSYLLGGGTDGYGTSFLGNYSIYAGGGNSNIVAGGSEVTLQGILHRDETDATRGVANFTGVISGGNASGGGVAEGQTKALVFDNYQTLAQANFKYFDTATVQGASHVTLTNALNTNIGAWTVTETSELKVTSSAALGGGSVAVDAGSSLIYDSGSSIIADSMANALSGAGSFVKNGGNTLTMSGASTIGSVTVNVGRLAVGNTMTADTLTVGTGATLVLQDGAQLAAGALTNSGTIIVEGGVGLGADSAALSGAVEWTGGTLTLGSSSQYAATTTTLSGSASYMVLTLTDSVTSETTVSFALGDLVLDGGLLTFSMTGADTSAFNLDNFTLTTSSITGTASVSDSIFLSLNGTVYEGQGGADNSITFASVGDLPTDGSADGKTNYKLNVSAALTGPTTVNNLFLIPTDQAAGITLTLDAGNSLSVNGTLTVEGGEGSVNLSGGPATANDVKLTSGNLVLKEGATLTVGNSIVSTGGKIQFDGGTFVYGTGFTGDISSIIADGGTVKVATSTADVVWTSDVLAGHAVEKAGSGTLTLTLTGGSTYTNALTATEGKLALDVASGTATYNGVMSSGAGSIVKTGSGTLQLNASATLTGAEIVVENGVFQMGIARDTVFTSAPKSVSVADGATFALQGGRVEMNTELKLSANASFSMIDGSPSTSPSNPNFTINGEVTLGNADVTSPDEAIVHFRSQYDKTLKISGKVTGNGQLHFASDRNSQWGANSFIYLTNANNDFSGGVQIDREGGYLQVTSAGALGTGILNLNHRSSGFKYQGTASEGDYDVLKGGSDQIITGSGSVQILSGNLELQGANTYTGATTVTSGSLKVSGSIGSNASTNVYNVAKDATLVVADTGTVSNSSVSIAAKPSVARNTAEGTLKNVTVNTSGISRTSAGASDRGRIENGTVNVTADTFTIDNVDLINSLVSLQSSGSVTLNNVTIGAGTVVDKGTGSVELANSTLVLTSQSVTGATSLDAETHTLSVTSDALAGYTSLRSTLTLDLTKEFIDSLVAGASGNFTTIELTFTGTEAFWDTFKANNGTVSQTGALDYPMFGTTVNFGTTAGTVIISTAPANIPEPATAALGLFGLAGLMLRRRRRS